MRKPEILNMHYSRFHDSIYSGEEAIIQFSQLLFIFFRIYVFLCLLERPLLLPNSVISIQFQPAPIRVLLHHQVRNLAATTDLAPRPIAWNFIFQHAPFAFLISHTTSAFIALTDFPSTPECQSYFTPFFRTFFTPQLRCLQFNPPHSRFSPYIPWPPAPAARSAWAPWSSATTRPTHRPAWSTTRLKKTENT